MSFFSKAYNYAKGKKEAYDRYSEEQREIGLQKREKEEVYKEREYKLNLAEKQRQAQLLSHEAKIQKFQKKRTPLYSGIHGRSNMGFSFSQPANKLKKKRRVQHQQSRR